MINTNVFMALLIVLTVCYVSHIVTLVIVAKKSRGDPTMLKISVISLIGYMIIYLVTGILSAMGERIFL